MSSYLYDPHSIRQKPNRYYQRKGQIIRAKNLNVINPAISRDDAYKYLNAIKMYFPDEFTHPPCPDPPSNNYYLNLTAYKDLDFNLLGDGYFTQFLGIFERIKNIDNTNTCLLINNLGTPPPAEITFEQAKQYTWLNPEDYGTFIAAKQEDGTILNFDATTGVFRKFSYDEWANTLNDWEEKYAALENDITIHQYYCGSSVLYLQKDPRFITYTIVQSPQN